MTSGLRVTVLGVGDAFSALWYSSCLLVEASRSRILIDCPHPIRKMLREARPGPPPLDIDAIDAVVLTHLHADHASGIEGFAFYCHFKLQRRARVWAHPEVSNGANGALGASMGSISLPNGSRAQLAPEDFIEFHKLDEYAAVAIGAISIECRRTIHPIPTFALKASAGGATLGYSADTSYDPELIDWLADADIIIHETNHGIHTPYEMLAALPSGQRSRMRLIHYPDEFQRDTSAIRALCQGEVFEVTRRRD